MNRTKIEWVRNPDGTQGYSWNPITGCLNHNNGLCKGGSFPCYAYKLANGRLRDRYLANKNWDTHTPEGYEGYPNLGPFYPRFWPERIAKYFDGHKRPRGVFVCDMGELFGDWIPKKWQEQVFTVIKVFPNDRFYLLTKQPQNLPKWSPFPDNCWVGVTATNRIMFIEALRGLKDVRATVKYLSFEPLLDKAISNDGWIVNHAPDVKPDDAFMMNLTGINWIIIGAQTKPYKPPRIAWAEEIVRAADKAGIPVFLKDNLKPLLHKPEANMPILWEDYPFKLRQEVPQ